MIGSGPVLFIGAHPDDIEFGVGAAMAKFAETRPVYAYVATKGGYTGTDGKEKRKNDQAYEEGLRALKILGRTASYWGQFETQNLVFGPKLVMSIERAMESFPRRPEVVITHWHGDHHQDHKALNEATLAACRRMPTILGYDCAVFSTASRSPFVPNLFVGIEGRHLDRKIEAAKCHSEWTKFDAERLLRARAIYYGVNATETGIAEPLFVYRMGI